MFTAALLKALRAEGYHTALDTSGAGALAAARRCWRIRTWCWRT
ncbi:MAG: hypothetical protein ACLRZH_11320 [Ruthenibacterium lactatiformans]